MRYLWLALVLVISQLREVDAEALWHKNLERDGITIETRHVAGSKFKEFKATMTVSSSLATARRVMNDIENYTRWMKDCKESRRARILGRNSGIVYSVQSAPWPIADREAVVRYEYRESAKPSTLSISIAADPDALPRDSGRVRIEKLSGYWKFTDLGLGRMEVIYSLHSEPGGNLPAWAIAGMVAHLPFETLRKLRMQLEN